MKKPNIPHDESQRLRDLHDLGILDTSPEKELDAITHVAAILFNAPIALISLIDESRQWFKARCGLAATETDREVAFCAHAILGDEPFLVEDALKDDRFHDNPLVTQAPFVRFYIGIPLRLSTGSKIGTLCVIGNNPQKVTAYQINMLQGLADTLVALFNVRLESRRTAMRLATTVQESKLLKSFYDSAPFMMGIVEVKGDQIIHLSDNPATIDFFSQTQDLAEVEGKEAKEIGAPDEAIRLWAEHYLESKNHNRPVSFIYKHKLNLRLQRWLEAHVNFIGTDENGRDLFSYMASDITERIENEVKIKDNARLIQEQQGAIVESARMSALGKIASEIAHEINNPLSVVLGRARQILYLLENKKLTDEKLTVDLEKIMSTSDRIAKIVRGLRAFGSGQDGDPFELTRVQTLIDDAVELCRARFLYHNVALVLPPKIDLFVECRPYQVTQIIVNLLNNAFDAVKREKDAWVELIVKSEGSNFVFIVRDCGRGIEKDQESQMMKEFFSTKSFGSTSGMGLGLHIIGNLVRSHSGTITYELDRGHTSFKVVIPKQQNQRHTDVG